MQPAVSTICALVFNGNTGYTWSSSALLYLLLAGMNFGNTSLVMEEKVRESSCWAVAMSFMTHIWSIVSGVRMHHTTCMGLSWTAYSVVSPLLASRLALVRLWCLGFLFGCTEVPGHPLFVHRILRSPSTWRWMCFWVVPASRVAWLPPLPYFSQLASPLTF